MADSGRRSAVGGRRSAGGKLAGFRYNAIMPAVSVFMPCYNTAETLTETLDSLSRQTFSDFEVIAVDDGSTDSTLATLRDWAEGDARFRVLSRPHGGVIAAANAGLEACRAPYVARMDADDRAHPQRLAQQVTFLDAHPGVAAVSSLVRAFPENQVREGFRIYIQWLNSLVTDADIRREIFVESPLPNPSVTMRADWMKRMGGYQELGWPEDYDLWLRMYLAGARFAKIPEVLLEWREHPNRITRTDSRYSLENFIRAKAHYLARGPLAGRDALIVWGAGMMGRRLSKQLQRQNVHLVVFVDIDPKKIGRTRRGLPIIPPKDLPVWWARYENPVVLAAVGARGARQLIRGRLNAMGLCEGVDWWGAA
ncbi:MAG: glycosyltransferase [Chloroflexi bacterium]|nr:glycosyltransferase [Chloroflexota bacterium]